MRETGTSSRDYILVAHPIVRRRASPVRQHIAFAPHVEILVRRDTLQTLLEPFVLVGRVIRNEVQDDFEVQVARGFRELLEVLHGAKYFVDATKIGNVIAKVHHRARIDRRHPKRVDIRLFQMFQLARDT